MKKWRMRSLALAACAAITVGLMSGCGGGGKAGDEGLKSEVEATDATDASVPDTAGGEVGSESSAAPAGEPLKDVEFGHGEGFVIDLPAGMKHDKDMNSYTSADGSWTIWPGDASLFEKEDNYKGGRSNFPEGSKQEKVGSYTLDLVEDPSSFYGKTTQYFIIFNGRYPDFYGGKIMVSSSGDLAKTQTKEIMDVVATVHKKGDAAGESAGDAAGGGTKAPAEDPFKSLKIDLKPEETAAMSDFMTYREYLLDGKVLYGKGFTKADEAALARFDMEVGQGSVKVTSSQSIQTGEVATYLSLHGDDLYFVSGENGLFKTAKGSVQVTPVDPKVYDYFQIRGDKMYYCDKDHHFYKADLDGQNAEAILDKEVYYPYLIDDEWLIYQDDADGERLHLHHLSTGADAAITDDPAMCPVISGSNLFCVVGKDDAARLARIDLGKIKVEENKETKQNTYSFPIEKGEKKVSADLMISTDGYIYNGSDKGWALDQWKSVENDGSTSQIIYRYMGKDFDIYDEFSGDSDTVDVKLVSKGEVSEIVSLPPLEQ